MVETEIVNVIARANKEFVYNLVEGRAISKEDVKETIAEMLETCSKEECDYIMQRISAWLTYAKR
jgi:hypothetical protein